MDILHKLKYNNFFLNRGIYFCKFTISMPYFNFLIVRGRQTAVCEGPHVKLSGSSGVARNSFLCHQRHLPSGHWTDCSYRVAPRQSLSAQQPGHHWKQQSFWGCYTDLQSHQGIPHLLCPGLSYAGSWRSGDQSWMWARFQIIIHVCSFIITMTTLNVLDVYIQHGTFYLTLWWMHV